MNPSEKESVIIQITTGKTLVEWGGVRYMYNEPSPSIKYDYINKKLKAESDCEKEGFLTQEQEQKMLDEHGYWSKSNESLIKQMQEDCSTLRKESSKNEFKSREKQKINATIEKLTEEIKSLELKRRTFYFQTIEYNADYRAKQWLLFKCLHDEYGNKVWSNWEQFEEEVDLDKITSLHTLVFYNSRFTESKIREIARTEPWRSVWRSSCKTGTPIFDVPASHHTESQKAIVYWSMVYDSVYESLESPSQEVIDNDELLNEWFEEQAAKNSEKKKSRLSPITSNKKIAEAGEIFVPVDTIDDAHKVYNELNTESAKAKIKSRTKQLMKEGTVKEAEFSDTKRDLRMQATQGQFNKNK